MDARIDVVVVGAGSAGCVLAARLSEDPDRAVVLLEAGRGEAADGGGGGSFFDDLDEARTWPGLVAQRSRGGPAVAYLRGRGLGGSSAVNAMIAIAGLPDDYDAWERDHGCSGWGWDAIGPVLDRLPVPRRAAPRAEWGAVDLALVEAAVSLGWPVWPDGDPPWVSGAGAAPLTRTAGGRRVSSADVYLTPATGRANLTVVTDAAVDRVLVDGRRAVGVRLADGQEIEAGEVVLAAGAIHSPAILLRSGIDLPGVGVGLTEHPSATVALELTQAADPAGLAIATLARFGSGTAAADLQLLPMSHLGREAPTYGALSVALMRAYSRGTVALGADPGGAPVIELNLFDDERDVTAMLAGVRQLRRVLEQPAFGRVAAGAFIDDVGTGLESLGDDAEAVVGWLRGQPGAYVHAASTCRMGSVSDPGAVVDAECRVIGYDGIRVCDASVFPDLPRANPHLSVVAVAELLSRRWR